MDQEKFEALLILIVPRVVHLIAEKYNLNEKEAARVFYESELYAILEQEDTKVWHFSPLTLFNMYVEERETGQISFPEE